MEVIFYAGITILGWGIWLAPSQNIPFRNQQARVFYVTLANLILALFVGLLQGLYHLDFKLFLFPFLGGIIWSLGGWAAFIATKRIGMAKAGGIWAPINIISSIVWGMILFGEFLKNGTSNVIIVIISIVAIITGVIFIVFAGSTKKNMKDISPLDTLGLLTAIAAGILWGSYFVPIRLAKASMWITAFPMAAGMFIGSIALVITAKGSIKLEKGSYYHRAMISGILWSMGNYGSLKLMELIGTGKGFTIAQLCIIVNTLIGIFLFRNPDPKTKEAKIAFTGIVLAALGGIVLGNLK